MIENEVHIDSLIEQLEKYGEANADLLKLKTVDKASDVLSTLSSTILVGILCIISGLLISIGISYLIGQLLNSVFLGFLIVGAVYMFVAFILYKYKFDYLKNETGDIIIKEMLK